MSGSQVLLLRRWNPVVFPEGCQAVGFVRVVLSPAQKGAFNGGIGWVKSGDFLAGFGFHDYLGRELKRPFQNIRLNRRPPTAKTNQSKRVFFIVLSPRYGFWEPVEKRQ
jgi:hypothetical protein